ncbi:MAG: ferritin-like domain-containing protein [Gammaproteobacteria bacterium]
MSESINHLAQCFREQDPRDKLRLMAGLDVTDAKMLATLQRPVLKGSNWPSRQDVGYPDAPQLVDARSLPKRSLSTVEGRGAFFHAICHIEFTAINLALDAAIHFSEMPLDYYRDWLQIAQEEATHFEMLNNHLAQIGFQYGDFDAHSGMWELAERTAHDLLLRMALVPRVLEARGLDVTPPMIERLQRAGDLPGAKLLRQIYEDEIAHVAAGTRWFNYIATERGLNPEQAFQQAVKDEFGVLRGKTLNREGRLLAGFTESELECLVTN